MHAHDSSAHGTGYGLYILIWVGLIVLTGVTVAVAGIALAELTITVALVVAAIKSFLVIFYFMHLKYEVKVLIWSIVLPMIFVVWLVIALIYEGGAIFEAVY